MAVVVSEAGVVVVTVVGSRWWLVDLPEATLLVSHGRDLCTCTISSGRGTRAVTQGLRLEGPQLLLPSSSPGVFTSAEHRPMFSCALGLPSTGAGAVSGSYH